MSTESRAALVVGELQRFEPIGGHGWCDADGRPLKAPASFRARLTRFWAFGGNARCGGIGRIEEAGHPHDGRWLMFALRSPEGGLAPGVSCNVLLYEHAPDDPAETPGGRWPLEHCSGFELAGFAIIGSTDGVG